jgi:multiple sugar transport system substrate-binding protein
MRCKTVAAAVAAVAIGLAGCGGGSSSGGTTTEVAQVDNHKATTITIWSGFTSRELGILNSVLADFHKTHPWITVKSQGGISDDKIVAAIRGGNAPDVALSFTADNTGSFCSTGAWIDLGPYIKRDKVDVNDFPAAARSYTEYRGKRCALPALADVYGLYYNKKLMAAAGITRPPHTVTELTADAQKLTQRNPDGSLKVVGFDPVMGFYENAAAHFAPSWNAQWQDASGKSTLGTDPNWATMLRWQKHLIDYYGYDKLQRFKDAAGDEFSASNAFETGKLAMAIDGEYRTAFIAAEHPELDYGTAPFPVDPSQPGIYGGGYTTGNIIGIPRGSKHEAQAWELVKYLATDPSALAKLSNGLKNVPTTLSSLDSPKLKADAHFRVFLTIFRSPHTQTTPITPEGSANQELFQSWIGKWQAGSVPNLQAGLKSVDQQIDAQRQNATGGGAP